MPPKTTASSPKKQAAEPAEQEVPQMNPDVLDYLQSVSSLFPQTESRLLSYARACDRERIGAEKQFEVESEELSTSVRKFAHDRVALVNHVHELRRSLTSLSTNYTESVATFGETVVANKEQAEKELALIEAEVAALTKDSEEAEDWSFKVHRKKAELSRLNDDIEQTVARQKTELKQLEANAESEKRKLRDSLVRKLRRARDQLTSQTDDEISGKGNHFDDLPLSSLGTSSAPSAKQNEKLSREVTMYERDCESIRQQNQAIAKEEEAFVTALKSEKATNSVLVAKNASHLKAKRILQQQLKDVQLQFVGAMDQHHAQHADRLKAFRETVSSQAALIDDLQSELELHFADYDEAKAKLRVREVDAAKSAADVRTAIKFLHSCRQSEDPAVKETVEGLLPFLVA